MLSPNVMNDRHQAADSLDYFPTPPWATRALLHDVLLPLNFWVPLSEQTALDPCVGGGHMVAPLREVFNRVDFSDVHDWGINPPIRDFTFETVESLEADELPRPDWIFCNPPFNIADVFFERALAISGVGFAFFVRSSWLSGQERYNLIYRLTPPTFVVHFAERVALIEKAWDPEASHDQGFRQECHRRGARAGQAVSASDFMIEQAEMRVARERDLKLGAVVALVAGTGCDDCKYCGSEIPPERRSAAPFAQRCIECQTIFERKR